MSADDPVPGQKKPPFRSGFVALLGKPNAGKSTLLNALVGTKLAAVSALPQTTRERCAGIYSDDHRQVVFLDLPGLTEPDDRLNECLRANVMEGLEGVDAVLHLVDVADPDPFPAPMLEVIRRVRMPIVLAVNKVDAKRAKTNAGAWAGENMPPELRACYKRLLAISAVERRGTGELIDVLTELLPEGEPLYDPENLTDRDLRFLSQEMIREKLFLHLHEEIPYATVVQVEEFEERSGEKWFISAMIYVERESQKGIVIGRGGETLKKISTAARGEIERLCEAPVFLELRVKVKEKWRRNDGALRQFGFKPPKKRR